MRVGAHVCGGQRIVLGTVPQELTTRVSFNVGGYNLITSCSFLRFEAEFLGGLEPADCTPGSPLSTLQAWIMNATITSDLFF